MILSRRITGLTLALMLALSVTASAQLGRCLRQGQGAATQPASIDDPAAWGNASPTTVTFTSFDFVEFNGVFNPIDPNNGMASCASGFCFWITTLRVPTGVSLRALELSACDGDGVAGVEAGLAAGPKVPTTDPGDIGPFIETGAAATPGCAHFNLTFTTPQFVTVDNNNFFYVVQVAAEAAPTWDGTRCAFVTGYRWAPRPEQRRSPTFPVGHPQRRFIEALVAAGITGGCGGGNYCPDNFVTRGQMAVFLSAALGLHWPFWNRCGLSLAIRHSAGLPGALTASDRNRAASIPPPTALSDV